MLLAFGPDAAIFVHPRGLIVLKVPTSPFNLFSFWFPRMGSLRIQDAAKVIVFTLGART